MISHWLGWASLALCIALMLKLVARRIKIPQLNRGLRKVHIPFGVTLLVLVVFHGISALLNSSIRIVPTATGIAALGLVLFISKTYLLRMRLKKRWMLLHRAGTLALVPLLLVHIWSALRIG